MKRRRSTHPAIVILAWVICYPVGWYIVTLIVFQTLSAFSLPTNSSGSSIAGAYAAAACALLFLLSYPFVIILALARRLPGTQRVRSDLCFFCGYPRQGLERTALCPECGQTHKPRRYWPSPSQRKLDRLESIHNARQNRKVP